MFTRLPARMCAFLLTASLLGAAPAARTEEPLTPAQVEQFETVIRDYLLRNPEIIIEAINELEARDLRATAGEQKEAIATHRQELLDDPDSPVTGNPEGSTTIVEFFDYRCPYCKSVADPLMETIDGDGELRFVFKEFPILGPESVFAAKAALASHRQGKYREFHQALMGFRGTLDDAAVLSLAEKIGIDLARLKADMEAPEIAAAIDRNHALADALRITGTPAFVVGDQVIPGALSMEELKQLVEAQRSS